MRQAQLEMKVAALHEHIQKRYQIELSEFERDLHGLRVAIREAVKRRQRGVNGGGADESGAPSRKPDPQCRREPPTLTGGTNSNLTMRSPSIGTVVDGMVQRT